MLQFHTTDRPPSLHRHEGLMQYLESPLTPPAKLSAAELTALSDQRRSAYDRARIIHLSGGIVIETPKLQEARRLLTQSFALNVARNSGHAGVMLTGDSTLGKTTSAVALMRYVYNADKRQFPEFREHSRIPVAYVDVPPASTGKRLLATFAEFYGLTVTTRDSTNSLQSRVVDMINTVGTQLIVVDELHNLASRSVGAGESVDLLKGLSNDVPATFVYAGINLTESDGVLGGARGNQIGSRFAVVKMEALELGYAPDRKTWHRLLSAFEAQLRLTEHETGTLNRLSDYLYGRTSGAIGSLSRLLTGAAIEAIQNPELPEQITEELLETRTLDHTAETRKSRTRTKYSLDDDSDFA